MEYELLSKIYYKNKENYEKEYLMRYNGLSTVKLNIDIKGNPAFVVVTHEILELVYSICRLNDNLNYLADQLPGIALDQYRKRCIIDEIVLTNEIEGVVSTRKDISEILEGLVSENKHKRFIGIVNKYRKLVSGEEISLKTCKDIRDIYDELVLEEVKSNNKSYIPDGIHFRKNGVDVISEYNKILHKGVMPENEIENYMMCSLNILNDDKINILIRIAVFHYLFGYIHPFYNGNGRVSRFISSYLCAASFNNLCGYGLACTIRDNLKLYYKSFNQCNDIKNKGDITYFIINFLEIIKRMFCTLCNDIDENNRKLEYYHQISIEMAHNDKNTYKICYILFQETIFGEFGIDVKTLAKAAEISESKVREIINDLRTNELLILKNIGRKYFYSFDMDKVDFLIHHSLK